MCAKKLDSGFHFFFESKWMLSFKIVFIPLYLPLAGLTFYSLPTRMSYMVIYGTRTEFHLTKRVFALEISFTVQNASKDPGAHNGVKISGVRALSLRARIFQRSDTKHKMDIIMLFWIKSLEYLNAQRARKCALPKFPTPLCVPGFLDASCVVNEMYKEKSRFVQ